jgi:hypothetical protein
VVLGNKRAKIVGGYPDVRQRTASRRYGARMSTYGVMVVQEVSHERGIRQRGSWRECKRKTT